MVRMAGEDGTLSATRVGPGEISVLAGSLKAQRN